MTDRPYRFGVVAGHVPNVAAVTALARRAEELGYDTLVTPDPVSGHDPLTLLAAVAAVTTRLHFGTFVLASPFRDKQALSWQASTLHTISGGRFELGLGAGRPGSEAWTTRLGRKSGTAGERIAQLDELIAEVRRHEDRPRLLVAGAGPKLLDLAAREAEIVTFTWRPRTTEDDARSIVDKFREHAGARLGEIELNLNLIAAGEDLPTKVQPFIGASVADLAEAGAVTVLAGTPEQCVETIRRQRERLGISYFTVNAAYIEQFAPVVKALSGWGAQP